MSCTATYYRSGSLGALVVGSVLAISQGASADPVEITSQQVFNSATMTAGVNAPPFFPLAMPVATSGNFMQSVTGSVPGFRTTPYEFNTDGLETTGEHSVLGAAQFAGPGPFTGTATYNAPFLAPPSSFQILWGSPDPFNEAEFFSGPGGTGMDLGTFNGSELACSGACTDLVTFTDPDGAIGSVVLSNSLNGLGSSPAFEFAIPQVPLPPAIYLFGSVLGGAFWLGRRKRSAVSTLGA